MNRLTGRASRWILLFVYLAASTIIGKQAEAAFHLERSEPDWRPTGYAAIESDRWVNQTPISRPVVRAPAISTPATGNCARVAAAWPGDDTWVLRNARRESGCNPRAYPGVGSSGPYCGVLQMNKDFWDTYGSGGSCMNASIEQQVAAAWEGYKARGCQPWGCR